jgi:transcription termination factor Rho
MTRNADLLAEPDDLVAVDALRALMAAAIDEADGPAVDAARRLVDRLESSASNEAFISEISSATSL